MLFHPTELTGSFVIEPELRGDERGFFARAFCQREFADHELATHFVQANNSLSMQRGTLRGMHYQVAPHAETKLIRCIKGRIWDCILDLQIESPNFGKWFAAELSDENRKMMYIPKGFAHGFLSLSDRAEVLYLVDEPYAPQAERIVRWDDPKFAIQWPFAPVSLSEKDKTAPDFDAAYHLSTAVGRS